MTTLTQPAAAPDLTVLVLTWNRRELLRSCLRSLADQDTAPASVIVVDNGSTDGTADLVAREFPEVEVHRLPANLGCPAGRNVGIGLARTPWVLCLDDDGTVRPDAVSVAARAIAAHPAAAVIAGAPRDSHHPAPETLRAGPTFSFCGAIFAVARETFLRHGGFHTDGLRQGEEGDLSFRLHSAGETVVRVPSLVIDHVADDSVERAHAVLRSATRQSLLTAGRFVPAVVLPVWTSWKLLSYLRIAVRTGAYRPFLQGVRDGVRLLPRTWRQRRPVGYRTVLASTRWYDLTLGRD